MSGIVLVRCRECAGTGNAKGGIYQCGWCLGACHVAVDRTLDGGVPDGECEWADHELPALVPNPLILAHEK